jgi:hypothetical protein
VAHALTFVSRLSTVVLPVRMANLWAGRDAGECSRSRQRVLRSLLPLVQADEIRYAISLSLARPVLASTAELHQRIAQLEQALQDCYSTVTGTKALHPLIANGTYNFEPLVDNSSKPFSVPLPVSRKSSLSTRATAVKDDSSEDEVELGEVSSNMGLLTLGDEGTSRWHGGGGSAYHLVSTRSHDAVYGRSCGSTNGLTCIHAPVG